MPDQNKPAPSQPLTNSQRRLYKASYRPLTVPAQQQDSGRVLEKLAFLRGLDIQPQELTQLESDEGAASQRRLIEIIKNITTDFSFAGLRHYGPSLANTSPAELIKIGNVLAEMRGTVATEAQNKISEIQARYAKALPSIASKEGSTVTDPAAAIKWAMDEHLPVYDELQKIGKGLISTSKMDAVQAGTGTPLATLSPAVISDLLRVLNQRASEAVNLGSVFTYQVQIQPVGQLHLERIEMTPAGIEHGELVHSVPLTPKETINITHREWSVTTTTFENIVQDSFEGFSETGVSEKTDLSQATDNETKHSSALDVNGSVSASYNGGAYSVTASSAVDYRQQTDTQQIEKDSITHSSTITRNASARTKKDHKISFRVSSVAGAEDLAVQVLTNPSDTNAMRVDYFQLLRKWRVDLIRYGLRMTYDLVIPNPGLDLIGRTLEIQAIDEMLTTTAYSFGKNIGDITRDSWLTLSQQYGVQLDPPPEEIQSLTLHKEFKVGKDDSHDYIYDSFDFEVPLDYEINTAEFSADIASIHTSAASHQLIVYDKGDIYSSRFTYVDWLNGRNGKLAVVYHYIGLDTFSVQLYLIMTLKDSAFSQWQLKSWTALRNADQAAYDKRIEQAKDRKAFLQSEIAEFDALTLRKMEREEIMRWVLRWLLGPAFKLMPDNLDKLFNTYPPGSDPKNPTTQYAYPDVADLNLGQWSTIISYGEFIKYIHEAIEWENVLFFAYPYFWDSVKN